jgi:leader peptidase (prepilin peptidase) / N-methyltransferase
MAYAAFAALACAIVVASLIAAPGWTGAFGAGLGLLMAAVAVIDGCSFAIPNKLTLAACALGLANAANETFESIPENILHAAVRGILLALAFYLFRAIYFRVRHRHGLGLGDAKLAAAAGVWLDWALIPTAIELAALAALAVYAVSRLLQRRPFNPAAKLPFGLFFAPAIWVCWLIEAISLQP